jgi:hypothetical protein
MKRTVAILLVTALGVLSTPAQYSRVKEKARGFGGQMTERHNGAESGAPPPGTPPRTGTTAPAAPPTQATPAVAPAPVKPGTQQQAATKLKADIAAARARGEVSPEAKKQFVQDLQLAALGNSQPTAATLTQFTEQFLPAVAAKNVAATGDAKLVQNIVVALNCAGLSANRMAEITSEVETTLTKAGATTETSAAVGKHLNAIVAEVQSGSAR